MSELRIKNLREKLTDRVLSRVCKVLIEKSLNRVPPEVCKIIAEKSLDRVLPQVYKIMTALIDRVFPRACKILTEELKDVELRVIPEACKHLTDELAKVYTDLVLSHVGEFAKYFINEVVLVSACERVTEGFFDNMFPIVCEILTEKSTDQVLLPEAWELVIDKLADLMLPGVCEDLLEKLQEEDYIDPLMREGCDSVMETFKEYVETKLLPKAGSHNVSSIDGSPTGEMQVVAEGAEVPHNTAISPAVSAFDLNVGSPVGEMQVVAEGAEVPHNTAIFPAVSAFDLNVAYNEIHGSTSSVTVATSIHTSPRALQQPPQAVAVHSDDVALPSTPIIISPTTQDLPLLVTESTDVAVRSNTLAGELADAAGLIPSFVSFDLNVALDEDE